MRILFICSAKVWGGNEKWVSKAMAGLKQRHDVFFMGKSPRLQKQFGEDITSFWAPFRSIFDWKTKRIINKVLLDNKIDVVISTKKKEYFLAGLVTKNLGVVHLLRLGIVRKMKIPFWNRLVYQKLNDGIIVNAFKIKSELQKYRWLKKHPVKVIYNGLDYRCEKVDSSREKKADFAIVSTGMLTRRKGFYSLIEAIALLPEKYQKRLKVHFLGKGREEYNLKKQIQKRGLGNIIQMEGFVDPLPLLQKADLFCLLSRNEGVSNALLEAMSCSVPVLITNVGGSGEFVIDGENGFLTKGKPEEVAERIKAIMSFPEDQLSNIGKEGKQTVSRLFNNKRMVEEVESFLHNFA